MYWWNGQIWYKGFAKNGNLEGERREWDCVGNLTGIQPYCNGNLNGTSIYLHHTGKINITHMYLNGKTLGLYKQWDENSRLIDYKFYVHNKFLDNPRRIVLLLLAIKNKMRQAVKRIIRQRYLDRHILKELGNIVMIYYYKA
jgi:hypothetical protein